MSHADLNDSLQGIPISDISIYRPRPTRRSFVERAKLEQQDVCNQKIWVSVHSFIYLAIALLTIILLKQKDNILDKFYAADNGSNYQCCYCAWIAQKGTQNDGKEIEYSYCDQEYVKYDDPDVCKIDDHDYCTDINISSILHNYSTNFGENKVSTTSTIFFIPFPKWYLYYGILGLLLVTLYSVFICIATFKYNIRLSSLLFVGNIVVSIQCYYNLIKAYQYTYTPYNDGCPDLDAKEACYQNVVSRVVSEVLTVMVTFFTIYFIYPVVFYLFGCCIKRCPGGYRCSVIQSYIERLLLYIGVVLGLVFVIICFVVLIIVVVNTEKFEMMGGVTQNIEKWLCIIVGIILLVFSLDVFCLRHCRRRAILMIKARKIPKWKDAIVDIDEYDEWDEFEEIDDGHGEHNMEQCGITELSPRNVKSRNISAGVKRRSKPNSPLIE